jgi:phosphatidate cytidylyltransferase
MAMVEWALVCGYGVVGPAAIAAACVMPACWAVSAVSGSGDEAIALVLLAAGGLALVDQLLSVGVVLIGLGCVALLALRTGPGGLGDTMFLAIVIWTADLFSWAGRRWLRSASLAPYWWPGLTHGSLGGGIFGGALAGVVFAAVWISAAPHAPADLPLGLARGLIFGAMLGLMAQIGDAVEGALRRQYGRDGGGSLVPGHDGLLDRVAGLLAASPVIILMRLTAHGPQMWQ